jgi:hypothetical protein
LKFFKISKILEGEKFSSNGRVGFDYNKNTDKEFPSYVSLLKEKKKINKLYVSMDHSKTG